MPAAIFKDETKVNEKGLPSLTLNLSRIADMVRVSSLKLVNLLTTIPHYEMSLLAMESQITLIRAMWKPLFRLTLCTNVK